MAGTTTSFGNLSISETSWLDGFGFALADVRPQAGFTLSQQGSDVVLTYSVVPEPSTLALAALAIAGATATMARRRRRRPLPTPLVSAHVGC